MCPLSNADLHEVYQAIPSKSGVEGLWLLPQPQETKGRGMSPSKDKKNRSACIQCGKRNSSSLKLCMPCRKSICPRCRSGFVKQTYEQFECLQCMKRSLPAPEKDSNE